MKVALIFAGQLRKLDSDIFNRSLSTLLKGLDYSIFSYCWEETGESLNHSDINPEIRKFNDVNYEVTNLFKNFNLEGYDYESFNEFKQNLPLAYSNILNAKEFHRGTIHSLPQLYSIYKCFKLIKDLGKFDLVFR